MLLTETRNFPGSYREKRLKLPMRFVDDVLGRLPWQTHVAMITRLQNLLEAILPRLSPSLKIPFVVQNYADGELRLILPSQVWTVRLRQLTPSILLALQGSGVVVERISYRVAAPSFTVSPLMPPPRLPLSSQARQALNTIQTTLLRHL